MSKKEKIKTKVSNIKRERFNFTMLPEVMQQLADKSFKTSIPMSRLLEMALIKTYKFKVK